MIKLREKKSGKDILGTAENQRVVGKLGSDIHPNAPGTAMGLEFEYVAFDNLHDSVIETTPDGRNVYIDSNYNRVSEKDVEPYCAQMSTKTFTEMELHMRFLSTENRHETSEDIAELVLLVVKNLRSTMWLRDRTDPARIINATEMALNLKVLDVNPALVGIGPSGEALGNPAPSQWDELPDHPVEDWRYEIANDDTRLGYVDWCVNRIELAITASDEDAAPRTG